MSALGSRRNALAMTMAWWLLRRKLRKRARTAVAGLRAGGGLSLGGRPKRHRLRNVAVVAGTAAVGVLVWRRLRGEHGDDWGTWEPEPPAPAPPAAPASVEPDPSPLPTAA